ncbi:hypothetical protein I316_01036 [Kwoniella heveanensis BCC8398]|uniref:F-box domain-containing protein n=1 Tax=Kwoniella heveanensis BCC8398 TaxID=1296120 RepID=A0A1B9H1I0_9TREE|nr:hypothetical protein I316_01036 [Kwoniella heveanensis BCC8398]
MSKRARSPSPMPRSFLKAAENSFSSSSMSTTQAPAKTSARHGVPNMQQSHQTEDAVRSRVVDEDRTVYSADSVRSQRDNTKRKDISDLFPFQEIFLRILSFLSPSELAQIQRVSKYWGRMSVDPQLWKRLYLARYPHPHHSRLLYTPSSSSVSAGTPRTPRPLRPIARLPSRAFPPPSPKRSPSISEGTLTPTPSKRESGRHGGRGGTGAPSEEVGHGVRNDGVDWKLMLRLGTNWSNGNALSQSTITLPPSPSPSLPGSTASVPFLELPPSAGHRHHHTPDQGQTEQFIALSPSFIFISSPLSPLVRVHSVTSHSNPTASSPVKHSIPLGIIPPPPGWSNPHRPDNVTAIVADQSVVTTDDTDLANQPGGSLPARIVVFYQSGGFVLLTISAQGGALSSGIKWKRESIHPPHTRPHSIKRRATAHQPLDGDPVVLAALHFPVLISCTRNFHLSVYTFPDLSSDSATTAGTTAPKHLKTLHSEVSFHPAALSLFPSPTAQGDPYDLSPRHLSQERDESDHFRAALTYCTPLYPSSWTVAVQELSISQNLGEVRSGDAYHVGRSGENGDTDEDETIVWPRKIRPIVGVKGKATGVGSDGRWCVLSGEESQIQVYSLPHHSRRHDDAITNDELDVTYRKGRVRDEEDVNQPIVHSQTLLAHSTEITSLALSSGRCVSGGRDGRVLVWELDQEVDADETELQIGGKNLDVAGRLGRTVGYVEVKAGGRRSTWRGAAGPQPAVAAYADDDSSSEAGNDEDDTIQHFSNNKANGRGRTSLPHPQAISSAARSLFLPRPPTNYVEFSHSRRDGHGYEDVKPAIRHLVFDEEKIVGLVRTGYDTESTAIGSASATEAGAGEVMKVWNFSG